MFCTDCNQSGQPLIIEKIGIIPPTFVEKIIVGDGLQLISSNGVSEISLEFDTDKHAESPVFNNVTSYLFVHGLNKIPSVEVLDLSNQKIGVSLTITDLQVEIFSNIPISGKIICN